MSNGYENFEELGVWQKARRLKNEIHKLVKKFPKEEKYRLVDQLIRSSRSISGQISERHGKRTIPDKLNYCLQARGSLSETLNHLIDAYDCEYITNDELLYYRNLVKAVGSSLNGYIVWLESQAANKK